MVGGALVCALDYISECFSCKSRLPTGVKIVVACSRYAASLQIVEHKESKAT